MHILSVCSTFFSFFLDCSGDKSESTELQGNTFLLTLPKVLKYTVWPRSLVHFYKSRC